jgi:hypothetical protein
VIFSCGFSTIWKNSLLCSILLFQPTKNRKKDNHDEDFWTKLFYMEDILSTVNNELQPNTTITKQI